MKKTRNNSLKRVAAGALSVLTVAAYSLPANVGGLLASRPELIASAADHEHTFFEPSVTPVDAEGQYTFNLSENVGGAWKSNNVGPYMDDTDATRTWNVVVPEGETMMLFYLVTSEEGFDRLMVYDNNAKKLDVSGNDTGYIELSEGTHVITATYHKDGGVTRGMDTSYVKFVPLCSECGKPEATISSILTFDHDIYADFAIKGATKVRSTVYQYNSMYWCEDTFTIYSNIKLSIDDNQADYELNEGSFTYSNKEWSYKYDVSIKEPEYGKNLFIRKAGMPDDYNYLDMQYDEWRTYDGKVPDISEFTLSPSVDLSDEEAANVQAILDDPATIKKVVWDSDSVDQGWHEGYVMIYNAACGLKVRRFEIAIEGREVIITPKAGQTKEYGADELPEIEFDFEAENGDRGLLATDDISSFDLDFGAYNDDRYSASDRYADVGEYNYELYYYGENSNYSFMLAEDSPTFTVIKRDISNLTLNIGRTTEYNEQGGYYMRDPNMSYSSDEFTNITDYIDFIQDGKIVDIPRDSLEYGGDVRKHAAGNYKLQVWGTGNYTGSLTADWAIKKDKGFIEQYRSSKVYDGKTIEDMFDVNTDDFGPDDNYTIKYFNDSNNIELDAAPSDAGSYRVEVWCNNEPISYGYFSISRKSLNSKDIKIELAENPSIIADGDDWTYAPDLTVTDGDMVLVEGTEENIESTSYDFLASGVRTKLPGVYTIEIKGEGNYTGFISTEWTVKEASKIDLGISGIKTGNKVTFTVSRDITDGSVLESGFIYTKTGADLTGIKLGDNRIDGTNIKNSKSTNTDAAGSVSQTITDSGNGISVIGYVTIETASGETVTRYTDVLTTTFAEASAEVVATDLDLGVSGVKAGNKVTFNITRNVKNADVVESGFIYTKTGADLTGIKLGDNRIDGTNIKNSKSTNTDAAGSVSQTITDSGNGISVIGYVTYITAAGETVTEYSDVMTKTFAEAYDEVLSVDVDLAISGVKTGNKVTFTLTRDVKFADVIESGFIYSKTGADISGVKLGDAAIDGTNIKNSKSTSTDAAGSVSQTVTDGGNGISVIGYVTYKTFDGTEETEYTDIINTTYADAAGIN